MRTPRPIRHWLIDHSSLYRRWIRWRFRRAMRRLETTMGRKLLPAFERATLVMQEWLRAQPP